MSTRGDIYSYGIMLLEILDMFVGELCLRQWVKASISDKIMEVIDGNPLRLEDGRDAMGKAITHCLRLP